MLGFKHLISSLFFFAAILPSDSEPLLPFLLGPEPCKEIELTYKVKHTSGGLANGEVEIKFKDEKQRYTNYLFSGNSQHNQLEITDSRIKEIPAGDYTLIVRNEAGCTRQLKIRIK
ncbi:MAG: hypothetical protein J0L66_00850 [Cytophagales bacterium]|nr:hypothetical protein [Cytophagales bacterium]